MRQESVEHKKRAAKQRYAVRLRDVRNGKQRCLLQRLHVTRQVSRNADGAESYEWRTCGRPADQTVHIIRRGQCGDCWDAAEVAILGCIDCHQVLDHNVLREPEFRVRVPYEYAVMAWEYLAEQHRLGKLKIMPYQRYNPYESEDYADMREVA